MILADSSIEEALSIGDIGIEPEPTEEQIQPASLDVRLGKKLYEFDRGYSVNSNQHRIQPGKRYLAETKEEVELPNHIAAQLAGRSSVGRQGVIVHKTAGWIDPGFKCSITLELMNLGDEPVDFQAGERIAQLVFFKLDYPSRGYDGHYQEQSGPTKAYNES